MTLTLTPTKLHGAVTPPGSKSMAHRLLIAAALAEGDSLIAGLCDSKDISATRRCLTELGAEFEDTAHGLLVHGMGAGPMSPLRRLALPHLDCGESGSTLRFLIPVALAVRGGGVFTGRGRLMERPLEPYFDLFREKGIFYELDGDTLTVQGMLTPGEYSLPGDVSSQFFTGLLFALPLLEGPSAILPTTLLESEDYIRLTLGAMDAFGVGVAQTMSIPPQYHILTPQTYKPANVEVEKDWSQAAFWLAVKALGGDVDVEGLNDASLQGDRAVIYYLDELKGGGQVSIDLSACPDLAPPLAAVAALRSGTTRFENAGRLRMKESDRLHAIAVTLNALGGEVVEGEDFLEFHGVERLTGGRIDSFGDHRIAMMAAVAALRSDGPVTVTGAECVDKSYPDFWRDYEALGGVFTWTT